MPGPWVAFLSHPLLTNGSGDSQGPIDSPAVHVRYEAAQCFDAFLLILWETGRVGTWVCRQGRVPSAAAWVETSWFLRQCWKP